MIINEYKRLTKTSFFLNSTLLFFSSIGFIIACKSAKNNHIEAKNLIYSSNTIAFSNIKTDSFLKIEQPLCLEKLDKKKQYFDYKTANYTVNKVLTPTKNSPKIIYEQTFDDGRLPDGFSIAAVIIGLLAIPFSGLIGGTIAIILGTIGLFRTGKQKSNTGKGYAVLGIILGVLAIFTSFFIRNI